MSQDSRAHLMEHYGRTMVDTVRDFDPVDYERTSARFHGVYDRALPLTPQMRVLDVGCGDGHFLHYLKSRGVVHLTGIDSSDDRLARCRSFVGAHVEKADAFAWLKAASPIYDLVACNHMIEHFHDSQLYELVEGLTRALAPGGRLLVTTPNATTPWSGHNLYSDLTHVRLFTTDSLTQLLSIYGLETSCYPEEPVPYDLGSALKWALWSLWKPWLKLSFRVQIGGSRNRQKTAFLVSPNIFAIGRKPQ